jgi:hypothetical protein
MSIAAEADDLLRQIRGVRERRRCALRQDLEAIDREYDAAVASLERGGAWSAWVLLLVLVGAIFVLIALA